MFFELPQDLGTSFQFSELLILSRLLKTPFDSGVEVNVSTFLFYHITVRSFTVEGGVLQFVNIMSLSSVRPTEGMRDKKC